VKVPPGYIYLVRLMFAEPCEQAFWDAASACLEAVTLIRLMQMYPRRWVGISCVFPVF
jgi:hypothetical protein